MSRPGALASPWLALLLPPSAWVLFEYGLGTALAQHCHAVGGWLGATWGGLSLLACLFAALVARRCAAGSTGSTPPRRWLAAVALLGAAVFALAILYQTLATLIIPPCVH